MTFEVAPAGPYALILDMFAVGRRFSTGDGGGNNDSGDEGGAETVSGALVLGVAVISR